MEKHNFNIGYDTIHLYLPINNPSSIFACPEVTGIQQTIRSDGSASSLLRLRNLTIKILPRAVRLRGSLATYANGDNLKLLTATEVGEVLDELSTKLGLDLRWASVTRLDYALTAEMVNTPTQYLKYFFPTAKYRLDRSQVASIYVQDSAGHKTTIIYDKSYESKICGRWLRIENRYRGRKTRYLNPNDSKVLASDLCESSFESDLCRDLLRSVEQTLLRPTTLLTLQNVSSYSDLYEFALNHVLTNECVRDEILRSIESGYADGRIKRGSIYKLRKLVRVVPSDQADEDQSLHELYQLTASLSQKLSEINCNDVLSSPNCEQTDVPDAERILSFISELRSDDPQTCIRQTNSTRGQVISWRQMISRCYSFAVNEIVALTEHDYCAIIHATDQINQDVQRDVEFEIFYRITQGLIQIVSISECITKEGSNNDENNYKTNV